MWSGWGIDEWLLAVTGSFVVATLVVLVIVAVVRGEIEEHHLLHTGGAAVRTRRGRRHRRHAPRR